MTDDTTNEKIRDHKRLAGVGSTEYLRIMVGMEGERWICSCLESWMESDWLGQLILACRFRFRFGMAWAVGHVCKYSKRHL
jgi:hypothetical protein